MPVASLSPGTKDMAPPTRLREGVFVPFRGA